MKKKRVVVAMSGGVDSSVSAALLVEQGYDVIGMMMRLWSETATGDKCVDNRCCTPEQLADAERIAGDLGIPFYVVDVQSHFRETIVKFFLDEYAMGRTPNPCIECNRQIRFTYLYNQAMALDADYLATGHYAQVRETADNRFELFQGVDTWKDQSYVLHMLTQEHLAHVLFPIGGYSKPDVRKLAAKFGLPVASKKDSQDLCFLGDGDYRRFLRDYAPDIIKPGAIIDSAGNKLGEHTGLPYYTMGQRKGLGLSTPQPKYVLGKDAKSNSLIVGDHDELGSTALKVRDVSWIGTPPTEPIEAKVKIRYKSEAVMAMLVNDGAGKVSVTFNTPVNSLTAGQSAVFYDGDICLGGGIIADETSGISIPLMMVNEGTN